MKKLKKMLSLGLVLLLVMSSLTLLPLTASAENGLVPPAIAGIEGAGTEASPYLIANVEDLGLLILAARNEDGTGIAAGTVTYVKLTADISLPVGEEAKSYSFGATVYGSENETKIAWRIDGQNYAIRNMVYPLFGGIDKTEDGVEIKNLKLYGNLTHHNHRYMGMLAGAIYGNVTIDNCHSNGTVTTAAVKDVVAMGGLVGLVSKFNVTIKNCTNSADITNSTVAENGDALTGGIVGSIQHYTDAAAVTQIIENCTNSGMITVTNANALETVAIGGIVGSITPNTVRNDIQYEAKLLNCTNTGAINCEIANKQVGDIAGLLTVQNAAHGVNSSARVDIIGYTGTGDYAVYNRGQLIEAHAFSALTDCECDDEGCTYTRHTYEHSWDAECANGCGYSRPFYGTTSDDKTRDYTWYYKEGALVNKGTATAPYEIANAAQLAALSALTYGVQDATLAGSDARVNFNGKYFKLTADIDMTGYKVDPINMDGAAIVFDGNGKKIANWTVENTENGGVFSVVGKNSTVKNVTLDNVDFTATNTSAALIAIADVGLTVSNVKVNENCSVAAATSTIAAGIVGSIINETATPADMVKIIFCVNNADVSAKAVVGGIVGRIKGNFNYQITHCVNKGDLAAVSTANEVLTVGGILASTEAPKVAQEEGGYISTETFIANCYNKGKLSTANTTAACYVGGIGGFLLSQEGAEVAISYCYDLSARKVSATSDTYLKNGGIAGDSTDNLTRFVEYCYAANASDSENPYTKLAEWKNTTGSQIDDYSSLVPSDTAEIFNAHGEATTMKAEMEKIDSAIATQTEIIWNIGGDGDDGDGDGNGDGGDNTTGDNSNDATNNGGDTTTQAPADTTTVAADDGAKKKGCGSALESTYAVIALVAVLGFAFVAKKKEEN